MARQQFKALETHYRGYRFRSRTEARWAVFFDHPTIEIEWEYEPEGYRLPGGELYLPDFWLPQVSMFAEVKPGRSRSHAEIKSGERAKAVDLALVTGKPVLILDGPPRETNYWAIWPPDSGFNAWTWVDVDMFDLHRYHLTEGRFYASTGAAELEHVPEHRSESAVHPAVEAARSARFDGRER
ncbi:MAG: hypothetical protein ABFC80_10015 [Coriobacteriales bacterium]